MTTATQDNAARKYAGSGQYGHEIPTRAGNIVAMRDGCHDGTDVYYSELGECYVFVGHGHPMTLGAAARCLLIRGQDLELLAADHAYAWDLNSADGLCLAGIDLDDELKWISEGAEVLWDSKLDPEE